MRDDDPDSSGNYTYANAMSDWAAEQESFMRRAKGGVFHPHGNARGLARVWGYAWRMGGFIAVLAVVGTISVRRYIGGEDFAKELGDRVAAALGAESVTLAPFRWKGRTATSPSVAAAGSGSSFFRSAEGRYVSFKRPFWALFAPAWDLGVVEVGELAIELQAGGFGFIPETPENAPGLPVFPTDSPPATDLEIDRLRLDEPKEPAGQEPDPYLLDLKLKTGGLGLTPRPDEIEFGEVRVALLDAHWGLSESTRGSLTGVEAVVVREGEAWTLTANRGTLRQNWLRDLHLRTPLVVRYEGGVITFDPCEVAFGDTGGLGTLSGTVVTGDIPTVDITLAAVGVPLATLLGEGTAFSNLLRAKLSGDFRVSGSTNTTEGIEIRMENAQVTGGILSDVGLLNVLALPTSKDSFRHLAVGGTISFHSAQDRVEITHIDLASGEDVRIGGAFTASPAEVPVGEPPATALEGLLRIGLAPALLDGYPTLQASHFPDSDQDLLWMEAPLSGTGPGYTGDVAEEILGAYKVDKADSELRRVRP